MAIAWLPGPAGTRRRVAKLSVEEPDAAEPARPDLWGAKVSNDPGLPDRLETSCLGLDNQLLQRPPPPVSLAVDVQRRERLAGLLNFYHREAA